MRKKILSSVLCLTLIASLLSVPGTGAAMASGDLSSDTAATGSADAVTIAFEGSDVTISGDGASLEGDGEVRIGSAGVYRLTGASDMARVVVSADGDADDVTIVLDGCDLTYTEDETIYFKSARSAVLRIADGTVNRIVSGVVPAETEEAEAEEDASGAAIRAKCPLTVTGGGTLTVFGYINNGIASTEDLTIDSGDLTVTAANDGIKSDTALTVSGGILTVIAAHDGLQSDDSLTVTGGDLTVTAGGGADEESMKTGDSFMMGMPGGGFGGFARGSSGGNSGETTAFGETANSASGEASAEMGAPSMDPSFFNDWGDSRDLDSEDSGSKKGLKAANTLVITGGTFTLDTADDAIHSNGTVTISGGVFAIRSGDDGVHGDTSLVIDGDVVLAISLCYEGLEAPSITLNGGYIDITAADDGLNANGGMGFGPGPWSASSEESAEPSVLRITGGTLIVDSGGDGLDSNGDLFIEGGTILVSGPSSGADAALDSGERGEFLITGGTLMAAGYSFMMESPESAGGSQLFIYYIAGEYLPDGTAVTLTDDTGTVIAEYSFAHSFNCVVLSSPLLEAGRTYTLAMGDITQELTLTETGYSNGRSGGMGPMGGSSGPNRPGAASGEPSA